jgi:hypothetical protein
METKFNKIIDITEETMRSKQILVKVFHEIYLPLIGVVSIAEKQMLVKVFHKIYLPLIGVVSIAEILATTKLDPEQ